MDSKLTCPRTAHICPRSGCPRTGRDLSTDSVGLLLRCHNAIQKISNKISTNLRISTVPLEAGEHDLSLGGFKPVHDTGNAALVVIVTEQDELPVDKFLVGDSSLGLVV
jgi:hypothetical protein